MWSSRICSGNFLLLLMLLSGAHGQEKNGEFKHELPEGVELVDPKSLGLTDADLSKFLGNVKVLGGGQIGDTKTQILSVGFEGDENINFNDFTIPGLTDGNKTALPEKDKEIADIAFQRFKEFFQDPNKAKQFEEEKNRLQNNEPAKHRSLPQQNNIHVQHAAPPQLRIPMIQKPYTTPRPNHQIHITTSHPQQRHPQPPPPPPPRQFNHNQNNAPQNHQHQQQHAFNSQIKSQPPLEFGTRIPVSPNPPVRPPPAQPPNHFQHQHQNQGQFQFHRQQERHQQHRLTIQHQQQGSNFLRPPPPPAPQQHNPPAPPPPPQQQQQQHFQHQRPPHHTQAPAHPPQTPRIKFPENAQQPNPQFPPAPPTPQHHIPPRAQPPQQPPPSLPPVSHVPRPPLVQSFVIHPHPQQHLAQQSQVHHAPPTHLPPPQQGRVVRNQLLLEGSNNNVGPQYNGPSKGLTPPPPPQSYQSTATNQVPVIHAPAPHHHHQHFQGPTASATATSSIYIHHGPKAVNIDQQAHPQSFHPQFQAPTRFAKDFTPMPYQSTTTTRPASFVVTPSMPLIPLSTNENAITDPTRTLQLRLYQQQKAQASMQHAQTVLPTQAAPTPPTTTPISITTSYPDTVEPSFTISSSTQYDFTGSQQLEQQQSFDSSNNNIANQVSDNSVYNNAPFTLQTQEQQHQLHNIQQKQQNQPTLQPQQQQQFHQIQSSPQPNVFYSPGHPPRQGPPRFQFHVAHDLGNRPRFQMSPDPKSLLNSIRRKRGYRRLSNLFKNMFRWDRH